MMFIVGDFLKAQSFANAKIVNVSEYWDVGILGVPLQCPLKTGFTA